MCLLRIGIWQTGQVVNTHAKWVSGMLPVPKGATRVTLLFVRRCYVTYLQVCRLLILHICCSVSVDSSLGLYANICPYEKYYTRLEKVK
jgi:hypothetical protein